VNKNLQYKHEASASGFDRRFRFSRGSTRLRFVLVFGEKAVAVRPPTPLFRGGIISLDEHLFHPRILLRRQKNRPTRSPHNWRSDRPFSLLSHRVPCGTPHPVEDYLRLAPVRLAVAFLAAGFFLAAVFFLGDRLAVAFFAADFLAAGFFLAAVFFFGDRLAVAFFAAGFLAAGFFLAAVFFLGDRLAVAFLAVDFLAADFLGAAFFLGDRLAVFFVVAISVAPTMLGTQ